MRFMPGRRGGYLRRAIQEARGTAARFIEATRASPSGASVREHGTRPFMPLSRESVRQLFKPRS